VYEPTLRAETPIFSAYFPSRFRKNPSYPAPRLAKSHTTFDETDLTRRGDARPAVRFDIRPLVPRTAARGSGTAKDLAFDESASRCLTIRLSRRIGVFRATRSSHGLHPGLAQAPHRGQKQAPRENDKTNPRGCSDDSKCSGFSAGWGERPHDLVQGRSLALRRKR
jgi:hypothetical protein